MNTPIRSIYTVTLNPTIDRIIEVPGFRVNEHLRGSLRWRAPAGKALNVSRVMASLGTPNTALGWVGQESMADFELAASSAGFAANFRPITGPTRENITIVDPHGRTNTHIRDGGPTITETDVAALTAELVLLSDPTAMMVFTGSLPRGLSTSAFGRMLDGCIAAGAKVVLDCSGEALCEAAQRSLWCLKPNRSELADLLGHEPRDEAAIIEAGKTLNQRIPLVLITLGEGGAYCFSQEGIWRASVRIQPDQLRSTVGCGDTMLGAFLSVLITQNSIDTALQHATAIAAASAMHDLPARFESGTVDMLLSRTELERLA
jgi:1-phosphofructokinase